MKKRYLFALSLICFNVQAIEMYQWVDEEGSIRVSETPPPEGVDFSTMSIDTSVSSNPVEENVGEIPDENAEETDVEKARRVLKEENCKISRKNMQELSNEGNLLIKDEQNPDQYIEVTAEMREQKIATTKADIARYCEQEDDGEESGEEFDVDMETQEEINTDEQKEE